VLSIGIFGSYAHEQADPKSDLDILVEFSQTPNLFQMMDLEDELSDLLGIEIDLVTRRSLRGEIGRRILAEVVPI
jgi:predicted nucleotidyltransferase